MAIDDVKAKVARRRSNLLEDIQRSEDAAREQYREEGGIAESLRLGVRDLRHRVREIDAILAILREGNDIEATIGKLEARRNEHRSAHDRLPFTRSYGPARHRLDLAARDCEEVMRLLRLELLFDGQEAEES